jgi:hypothetical protein
LLAGIEMMTKEIPMLARLGRAAVSVVCGAALLWGTMGATAAGPAGSTAGKTPAGELPVHRSLLVTGINPHLHVAATPTPKSDKDDAKDKDAKEKDKDAVKKRGLPVWDAQAYIALHRGLATIRGDVLSFAGKPVVDCRVLLKKPGGRQFGIVSRRHITHTEADGSFVMLNVRPGTYRVVAVQPKRKAFVVRAVPANSVQVVALRI